VRSTRSAEQLYGSLLCSGHMHRRIGNFVRNLYQRAFWEIHAANRLAAAACGSCHYAANSLNSTRRRCILDRCLFACGPRVL
jgi:hypothetical protein